ncbi:hypothetical protein F5Y11DRAFT_343192 [Daldinia sp. FL1419]|nr:hypothetical protein F5Y11DRAFT_343192 [Daldinia sp. FL1419]
MSLSTKSAGRSTNAGGFFWGELDIGDGGIKGPETCGLELLIPLREQPALLWLFLLASEFAVSAFTSFYFSNDDGPGYSLCRDGVADADERSAAQHMHEEEDRQCHRHDVDVEQGLVCMYKTLAADAGCDDILNHLFVYQFCYFGTHDEHVEHVEHVDLGHWVLVLSLLHYFRTKFLDRSSTAPRRIIPNLLELSPPYSSRIEFA